MRKVDADARTPPWQQIATDLRARLLAGEWGPSDRLPSISDLVAQWGVNRKTVVKAYKQLAGDDLVEVEPGIGYFAKRLGSKHTD